MALYSLVSGVAASPESDPTSTICPAASASMWSWANRVASLIGRAEVHVDREVDLFVGDRVESAVASGAGVRDEDVETRHHLREPVDVALVGEIGHDDLRTRLGRELLELCLPAGGHDQVGAAPGELAHHRLAEAAARPGDHDLRTLDLHRPYSSFVAGRRHAA